MSKGKTKVFWGKRYQLDSTVLYGRAEAVRKLLEARGWIVHLEPLAETEYKQVVVWKRR